MTDKSPELSGARDDLPISGREPVLTGHNARVLADRRGAYLAGNLKALIEMMSDTQQTRFKQWCIKIAVRKARSLLPIYERHYPYDRRPRTAVDAVERWLREPTTVNGVAARQAGIVADAARIATSWGPRTNDVLYIAMIVTRMIEADAHAVARTVKSILQSANWGASLSIRSAQLRAAYIILQGGE